MREIQIGRGREAGGEDDARAGGDEVWMGQGGQERG